MGAVLPDRPGLRLSAAELLALRVEAAGRHRPATRRPGAAPSRAPGSGMDLRDIRAFVPGDDPRRLDPSATARTGQPHVRAYHQDRDDATLLIADFRAGMVWGTGAWLRSVRGAHHLARAGWAAVARGGTVAGLALSGAGLAEVRAGSGDRAMAALCRWLAAEHDRAAASPGHPALAPALIRAARCIAPGGRVILITAPDGWVRAEDALAALARSRRIEVALILDPLDRTAPPDAVSVTDGAMTRHARLTPPDPAPGLARLRALGAHPALIAP